MSYVSIAFPVQSAAPLAQALIGIIRPLLGLGVLLALLLIFRPLLAGLCARLLVAPARQQHTARHKLDDMLMLNRMANRFDASQPNLAAELHSLAERD